MVVQKRKKVTKSRGHTSHGGGHHKKRRGAGSRGGRGNAGTRKRAGHKKAGMPPMLGRHGFNPRRTKSIIKALNLNYFTPERVNKLLLAGKAAKDGTIFSLDLSKLGCQKLLGTGRVKLKLKLKVDSCSPKAKEKVEAAGGEVIVAFEHKSKGSDSSPVQEIDQ